MLSRVRIFQADAPQEQEGPLPLLGPPQAAGAVRDQGLRRRENPIGHQAQIEGRGQGTAQLIQRRQVQRPARDRLVEAGILDGDGRRGGEETERLPVRLAEGPLRPRIVDGDDPDQPLLVHERFGQDGGDLRVGGEGRIAVGRRPVVVHDQTLPTLGDRSGDALAECEAQIRHPRPMPNPGASDQGLLGLLPEVDGARLRAGQIRRSLDDQAEDGGQVEFPDDLPADRPYRLQVASPLLFLLELARLLDRQRCLVAQCIEERDLVRQETAAALAVDAQGADDLSMQPQRDTQERMKPLLEGRPLVSRIVAGVLGQVIDCNRLSGEDDEPTEALPDLEPIPRQDGRRGLGSRPEDQLLPLQQDGSQPPRHPGVGSPRG